MLPEWLQGYVDLDRIDELGLTRGGDAEYWETATVDVDVDPDYWFEGSWGYSTEAEVEVSDDYWWEEEPEHDAGIGLLGNIL
jgi:hypothetical protein